MRTDNPVGVALAYDLCYDAWPEPFRRKVASALDAKATELIRGGGTGWNGSPASNWHANTRSAAGICALAIVGDPGATNAERSIAQALSGVKNYMRTQSAERGWTQESFAYYRYPLNHHLLPYLQIHRRVTGEDPFAGGPADWYVLLYVMLLHPESATGHVTIVNNAHVWERNHWRSGDFSMGIGTVPEKYRPVVHWLYQRWFGEAGDRTYDIHHPHHAIFALVNYPFEAEPINPAERLPRVWEDGKKGLYVFRNRWRDRDDAVLVVDANRDPAQGTGRPACSGAFALTALGGRWATTGASPWRSRFNLVHGPHRDSRAAGRVLDLQTQPDGSGKITLGLGAIYGQPPEQVKRTLSVDYSEKSGHPVIFSVEDQYAQPTTGIWTMHTYERATSEGNRFTLTAKNGAMLVAEVLQPEIPKIEIKGETIRLTAPEHDFGQQRVSTIQVTRADGEPVTTFHIQMKVHRPADD